MAKVVLGKKTLGFIDLEKKYDSFFAPAYEILIDGTNLVQESIAFSQVNVDMTSDPKADSFTFTVVNAYDAVKREFRWVDQYFTLGKYVEIKMGYKDKLETMFYGLITSVVYDYPDKGSPSLIVSGMDISFVMMKGQCWQTWKEKSYSDVVKVIGKKYVPNLEVDDTTDKMPEISKILISDYKFIEWMATECNYDFFVLGNTLYFRKPLTEKAPVVTLMFGIHLKSYNSVMNLSAQVSQVIVRGYDSSKKEMVEAKSGQVEILGDNTKTGKDIMKTLGDGESTTEYVYTTISNKGSAQKKADAMMNKKAMELVGGTGHSIGLPELQAGRYIKLDGLGKKLNQIMYLKSVTHTIDKSGYSSKFTTGGNAV